ncbi:MAG: hypothetical protein M3347_18575 [Armatimonadota bacterium]|nr:hypothetical protein [Armatimonadota bacterium]
MSKYAVVLIVTLGALLSGLCTAPAQAQTEMPKVSGLTPFTQEANYMSLPGYLRWQHLLKTGQWLSRDAAVQAVRDQGVMVAVGPHDYGWLVVSHLVEPSGNSLLAAPEELAKLGRSLPESIISPRSIRAL